MRIKSLEEELEELNGASDLKLRQRCDELELIRESNNQELINREQVIIDLEGRLRDKD